MFENPFGTNLRDLQNTYLQQMQTMQAMQQANIPILEEINKVVSSMSREEQTAMSESKEYQLAKQTYEAGFLAYLGNKFANEYVNTPDGKIAANSLLSTIKQLKDKVNEGIKLKQQKIDKLLSLLENDPDLKKKYEDIIINN